MQLISWPHNIKYVSERECFKITGAKIGRNTEIIVHIKWCFYPKPIQLLTLI